MLLYIVGNIVLLNLFLAILLANFTSLTKEEDEELEDSDVENQAKCWLKCWVYLRLKLSDFCPKYFEKPALAEREETTSSEESSKSSKTNSESNSAASKADAVI